MIHEVCQMMLGDISKKQVITLSSDDSVQKAAQQMRDKDVGSIVVVDAQQHPVGVLTDRDIVMQAVAENVDLSARKVDDFMSRNLLILRTSNSLQEAIRGMEEKCVRRAPVVDEQGALYGLIALDDCLISLSQCLSQCAELIKKQSEV